MLVLFEGRIHSGLTIKEIFKRIVLLQSAGQALLRVSSPDNESQGLIYLHDCTYVTGASIKGSSEVGYDALRKLVRVQEGSFALIAVQPGDSYQSDLSLNIELRKLAEGLDHLPESPSELFDQNSLLDKVFNPGVAPPGPQHAKDLPNPAQVRSIFGRVLLAPEDGVKPNVNWSAVQPFLGSDPGTASGILPPRTTRGTRSRELDAHPSDALKNTGELRSRSLSSLPEVERRRTVRNALMNLAAVTVFIVIMVSVAWVVSNYLEKSETVPDTSPTEARVEEAQPENPENSEMDVSLYPPKKLPGQSDLKSRGTTRQ
jgi:hypothetical protein